MSDDEATRLNYEAFLATSGAHREPERAIAALLRSDFEIDRAVRDRLAGLLDGKTEGQMRLNLQRRGDQKAFATAIFTRADRLEKGRRLREKEAGGLIPYPSDKTEQSAITYANDFDRWAAEAEQRTKLQRSPQLSLEMLFHVKHYEDEANARAEKSHARGRTTKRGGGRPKA